MWDVPVSNFLGNTVSVFEPRRQCQLQQPLMRRHLQLLTSTSIIYGPTVFFIKLSILLLYLRIFSISKTMRCLIYSTIVFLAVFYALYLGVNVAYNFVCSAFNYQRVAYCLDFDNILYVQGATNLATDVWILVLPIPKLVKLQVSKRRKIGIMVVFLAGTL